MTAPSGAPAPDAAPDPAAPNPAALAAAARPPRNPRRVRSATESLLSITLALEAILVFFVMLAVFGLRAVPAGVAFGGGIGLIFALVLVSGVVRYGWGVWLGWVLQAVLLATGIVLPVMYAVAAVFIGIWIFCFVKGRQLDAAKREVLASLPLKENQ